MADSLKRHLLITRRRIDPQHVQHYAQLWKDVQRAAEQAGARAWVFRAQHDADRYIEFVEWQSPENQPLTDQHELAFVLRALLDAFPVEESETWIEAKI